MTPADVRPKALWTSATHRAVASASASLTVTGDYWSTSWHFHLGQTPSEQCQTLRSLPIQPHRPQCLFSVLLIHEHPSPPPPQRSPSYLHAVGLTLSTPLNARTLSISPHLSLFLSSLNPPFLLSSPFSPWWYPCHVVMATIGPWLLGCLATDITYKRNMKIQSRRQTSHTKHQCLCLTVLSVSKFGFFSMLTSADIALLIVILIIFWLKATDGYWTSSK